MNIYLMRHGETDYNQAKRFYGATDVSLNEKGIRQSLQLRKKMELKKQCPVYTSTLKRTIETAKLIYPQADVINYHWLNEKDFGQWEGLTANEIEEKYEEEWDRWLSAPFSYTPPAAEPFEKFKKRVLEGIKELLEKEESFILVGHLGVLRLLLEDWLKIDFWEIQLDQGNYTKILYQNQQFKIEEWNQ